MERLTLGDVHVWSTHPEWWSPDQLERSWSLLSSDERDANARFRTGAQRRDHLLARALVRTTLSRYADVRADEWIFRVGPFGRPEIAAPASIGPLRFNLSHTSGLIALAVTLDADIGLDVERLDGRRSTVCDVGRYFAPSEVADLESSPSEVRVRRLLEYWTLKEAYIKATGFGLSIPLDSFAMRMTVPPTIVPAKDGGDESSEWQFFQPSLGEGYLAAIAMRCPSGTTLRVPTCFTWQPRCL